jgi:hypothetical protein
MYRPILIGIMLLLLIGCASTKNEHSSKRGLMLLSVNEQPRNAKFASPKYQSKLQKNRKQHQRDNHRSYKRALK